MTKMEENNAYHFIGIGDLGKMIVEEIQGESSCEWIKNPGELAANADIILQQHNNGYGLIVEYEPEWDTYLNNPQILDLLHHADFAVVALHQSQSEEFELTDRRFLYLFNEIPKTILSMPKRNRRDDMLQMRKGIACMIRAIYAPGVVCIDLEDIAIPGQNHCYGTIYHASCEASDQMPECAERLINHTMSEICPQDIIYFHLLFASGKDTTLMTLINAATFIEDALKDDTRLCWSHIINDHSCDITFVVYRKLKF